MVLEPEERKKVSLIAQVGKTTGDTSQHSVGDARGCRMPQRWAAAGYCAGLMSCGLLCVEGADVTSCWIQTLARHWPILTLTHPFPPHPAPRLLSPQLNAIRNQKAAARREQRQRQKAAHAKKVAAEEEWRAAYNK